MQWHLTLPEMKSNLVDNYSWCLVIWSHAALVADGDALALASGVEGHFFNTVTQQAKANGLLPFSGTMDATSDGCCSLTEPTILFSIRKPSRIGGRCGKVANQCDPAKMTTTDSTTLNHPFFLLIR